MSDSNEASASLKELLARINVTLREYFDVRRKRAENKLAFDKQHDELTASYDQKDKPLAEREAELATHLRELLVPNKASLLTGKLRSFSTTFGSVSFKKKAETAKVVDPEGLERLARKDGKLGLLGGFTRTWKPLKAKDILALLDRDSKLARKYGKFVETDGGFDELYVQPKDAYLTEYDPNRLTAKSVNLGRADDVED